MRGVAVAMTLVALCAVDAEAQVWSSDRGGVQLTYPDSWRPFVGGSSSKHTVFAVGPAESQNGSYLRECTINLRSGEVIPPPSQERLNAITENWDRAHLVRTSDARDSDVIRFANEMVGGVRVASMVHRLPWGDRMYQHQFLLSTRDALLFYSIYCGVGPESPAEEMAEFDAFMESLTFTAERETT
jgi:hypothetical protein